VINMVLTLIPDPPAPILIGHDENVVQINTPKAGAQHSAREVPPGFRVPRHGHGLLRPWPKGQSARPDTRPSLYVETMRIARQHSPQAIQTLIERMKDADGRIAVVAANSVLERAFGKPREMKPEEQQAHIDLSSLSGPELQLLLRLVESGRLRSAAEPASDAAEIDGVVATVDGHR
jgi:hypothetical protein